MEQSEFFYVIVGDCVRITPTDPWDLVTEIGSGPFDGTTIAVDESDHAAIIVKLDSRLAYQNMIAEFLLAHCRTVGSRFGTCSRQGSMFCNLASLSEEEARSRVTKLRNLEGRLAMLGDVSWTASTK